MKTPIKNIMSVLFDINSDKNVFVDNYQWKL